MSPGLTSGLFLRRIIDYKVVLRSTRDNRKAVIRSRACRARLGGQRRARHALQRVFQEQGRYFLLLSFVFFILMNNTFRLFAALFFPAAVLTGKLPRTGENSA